MATVAGILNQAFPAKSYRKLNILTAPTHEAYETNLCETGHNFYAFQHEVFKKWNDKFRPVPKNYTLLEQNKYPSDIIFDLVLSQNKFGQFQILHDIAKILHIPLISLEHTLPMKQWGEQQRNACRDMRGNLNVFISDFSVPEWKFNIADETVRVVHHGINTNVFSPDNSVERNTPILCVVNDWINRDWCCGYKIFERTAQELPVKIVGDTPGLSKPSTSVDELVSFYRDSRIFYNTSTISPVPTALMEAMACGCAVVSTATCMIPEIIKNGYNGFISNDEKELRDFLMLLLEDPVKCEELGRNARKTIIERFSCEQFVNSWNKVLLEATGINPC
jgi:glycosyltransferase involved in cell wall biosynthesis